MAPGVLARFDGRANTPPAENTQHHKHSHSDYQEHVRLTEHLAGAHLIRPESPAKRPPHFLFNFVNFVPSNDRLYINPF